MIFLTDCKSPCLISAVKGCVLIRVSASLTEYLRYNPTTDKIEIYYNGSWVEWKTAGLQFDGILYDTGAFSSSHPMEVNHTAESGATASATLETSDIKFEVSSNAGTHNANAYVITSSPIDISGYSYLKNTRTIPTRNDYVYEYIGIMPTKTYDSSAPKLEALSTQGTDTKIFDISSYSGEYYIIAGLRITGSGSSGAGTVYSETLTKLWLE